MPEFDRRLDAALAAVKALPVIYHERALVALHSLGEEWRQQMAQRLDDRKRRRWAELNLEVSRRLQDLRDVLRRTRR
jgi:hypothetical protein